MSRGAWIMGPVSGLSFTVGLPDCQLVVSIKPRNPEQPPGPEQLKAIALQIVRGLDIEPSAAAIAAAWNEHVPPDTTVLYTDDQGLEHESRTRTRAWVLGDHTPVVKLAGVIGCYELARVRPLRAEGEEEKP